MYHVISPGTHFTPAIQNCYTCSIRAVSEAYQCKNASGNDQL